MPNPLGILSGKYGIGKVLFVGFLEIKVLKIPFLGDFNFPFIFETVFWD